MTKLKYSDNKIADIMLVFTVIIFVVMVAFIIVTIQNIQNQKALDKLQEEYNKYHPICPGKTMNQAIVKNECEFYKFALIATNPDQKSYILNNLNCSCEALEK